MRYTKEYLEPIVKRNTCVSDVVREIGVPCSGGNCYHIGRMIRKHRIDTSHFDLDEARGRWKKNGNSNNRKEAHEILVYGRLLNRNRRERGETLGRALQDIGRPYQCSRCGTGESWQNEPLTLHVDHIDNDWFNNIPDNLRFLCPNCHSQRPPVKHKTHHTCY